MKNRADFIVPADFLMVVVNQSPIEAATTNHQAAKLVGVVNVHLAGVNHTAIKAFGDFKQSGWPWFVITIYS